MTPYPAHGLQGGFNRYFVNLRVTDDPAKCPSTDEFVGLVVWAESVYGAHAAACVLIKEQGREVRHTFGVVEWPWPGYQEEP